MADTSFSVRIDPVASDLIADVCRGALDASHDGIADAVGAIFESLEGQLFEVREASYPRVLDLQPDARRLLLDALAALVAGAEAGTEQTVLALRLLDLRWQMRQWLPRAS